MVGRLKELRNISFIAGEFLSSLLCLASTDICDKH